MAEGSRSASMKKNKTLSFSSYAGFTIPEQWEEVAQMIAYNSSSSPEAPPPIVVVCGPGNSGKSTFTRVLLNTLLLRYDRVGYLDTDVGQSEFSIPGCISLHIFDEQTRDFTILSLKTPERCLFFGDIAAVKDPEAYTNYICSLYDYFLSQFYQHKELKDPKNSILPLIINTSGWIKGYGYKVLVKILQHIFPTHVVQIRVSDERKNLPRGSFWVEESAKGLDNVIEISAAQKNSTSNQSVIRKEAHIIRDLKLIAYFRQCLPRELEMSCYLELVHCLDSILPREIPLSRIKVMHLGSQVPSSEVHGLDKQIFGLAVNSSITFSSEHCAPWCVGFGIVQKVDIPKDLMYLITPVPVRLLEKIDLLLSGNLEIPTCLLQVPKNLSEQS